MSWGNPRNSIDYALKYALSPFSVVYGLANKTRRLLYNWKLLKESKPNGYVISIGNLTVGGTGKTPLTIDLAQRLIDSGNKVAILSRGYNRKSNQDIVIASDGQGNHANLEEVGDEPFMMAHRLKEAVIIVGKKRSQTAELAHNKFQTQILILDDGYQHLAVKRDLNIVLIDYNDDPERDSLLPSGRLREPLSELRRADWVIITKVPKVYDQNKIDQFEQLIKKYNTNAKISSCRFISNSLKWLNNPPGNVLNLEHPNVLSVCGLARPEQFFNTVDSLEFRQVLQKTYADHYWYTKEDINEWTLIANRLEVDFIVTSEKDAMRLTKFDQLDTPICFIEQAVEWLGPIPYPDKPDIALPLSAKG